MKQETWPGHFRYLREWNGVEGVDSEAALIFHAFMRSLTINLYGDELSLLGKNYLDAYTGLNYLVNRNIREVLKNKNSSWIDNIETKLRIEFLDEIIYTSITNALTTLKAAMVSIIPTGSGVMRIQ